MARVNCELTMTFLPGALWENQAIPLKSKLDLNSPGCYLDLLFISKTTEIYCRKYFLNAQDRHLIR